MDQYKSKVQQQHVTSLHQYGIFSRYVAYFIPLIQPHKSLSNDQRLYPQPTSKKTTTQKINKFREANAKVTVLSHCATDEFCFKTNFVTTSKEEHKLQTLLHSTTMQPLSFLYVANAALQDYKTRSSLFCDTKPFNTVK